MDRGSASITTNFNTHIFPLLAFKRTGFGWGEEFAAGRLRQLAAQRQDILRAAFSGQLVPQDPNDEPASALLERIRAERAERDSVKKPRGRKVKEASL